MAKEQNVSVNLSSVANEPYGTSGGGGNPLVTLPAAMPVEPEEERESASVPSTTRGGTPPDHEVVAEEGSADSKSPSVKSKSPPESSSTSSSSPDSDFELGAHQMTYKSKDFPVALSPERAPSVKRRLWDVDRKEVDESLNRELKRIRQEDSLVKSSKWNFDFEKDVPLSGSWDWEKAESPPEFYKTKECPKKKSQSRYLPYERPSSISQSVSSSSLPHTSSASLVSSSRELSSLRSAVTSSVSTPEASTKESVGSSVQTSSVSTEETDKIHGTKTSPGSSHSVPSMSKASTATSNPDIYSPDYFKPPTLHEEQYSQADDIPKTSSSVSSSTNIASSSSSVSNNGSSCVSSSSSSSSCKNITEISNKNTSTGLETSSSSSGLETSSSSSGHGINPSQFYSSELDEKKEDRGADSSTTARTSDSAKPQEKRKLKPPKPSSSSGDTSPSPLLKFYR